MVIVLKTVEIQLQTYVKNELRQVKI